MADLEDVIERLDLVLALLRLAFSDRIQAAREEVVGHPVNEAILERTRDGWVAAGELTRTVMESTRQSNSAVRGRIADLVSAEILAKRGAGQRTEYRAIGLI